ncbi:endonuclease/exonuclease/phosphatase family protein [Nocardia sp. NPDC088792]|uniref:endonuclease/exonuclease/phosphatase family protein n=1 Tax=Nocardia sp. NPDC088792 TaxID=3364332 RepID=UPI00382C60A5
MRVVGYNLLNYGAKDSNVEQQRRDLLHSVIRGCNPDVLAVQEIWAEGEHKAKRAAELVHELAEATGLRCDLPDGRVSVAIGNLPFHTAVLWTPGIEAVAWYSCSGTQLWHGLAKVDLDIGGQIVSHASVHATPFGRHRRADENERILSIMTRPDDRPPGLIAGDFNCLHADRILVSAHDGVGEGWEYYDHDPYQQPGLQWHPDFVYQCEWDYDERGQRRWWGSRGAAEVLWAGGLTDTAAHLRVPWQRTCGYWETGDPFPDRRVDAIKVTHELLPTLRAHQVVDNKVTTTASDHLPVVVEY